MFSTQASSSPKKYVPVELRPKEYSFGGDSPRARRFVTSVRQLVHHSGATNLGTIPASLVVDDVVEPLPGLASNAPGAPRPGFSESPTLDDIIEKTQSK